METPIIISLSNFVCRRTVKLQNTFFTLKTSANGVTKVLTPLNSLTLKDVVCLKHHAMVPCHPGSQGQGLKAVNVIVNWKYLIKGTCLLSNYEHCNLHKTNVTSKANFAARKTDGQKTMYSKPFYVMTNKQTHNGITKLQLYVFIWQKNELHKQFSYSFITKLYFSPHKQHQ